MKHYMSALLLAVMLPLPATAKQVKIQDDLTIHYQEAGSGTITVVLVPGWMMSGDVFVHQLEHYRDSKQVRAITFDPRSQGYSTQTLTGNNYEQHGRDLNALIQKLDLKNIVLVGWSNGAFDILSYLRQFGSSRLKGFVILDGAPKGSGADNAPDKDWVWFRNDDADGYIKSLSNGPLLDREKMNDEFARWMIENPTSSYLDWITRIANQTRDEVASVTNTNSAYQDYTADLRALNGKLPLLYFVRAEWVAADHWAKANTPDAVVVRFGKHLSFWEHPEQFNQALDSLLAKIHPEE